MTTHEAIKSAIENGEYNELNDALAAIDIARESDQLTAYEARLLEAQAETEF